MLNIYSRNKKFGNTKLDIKIEYIHSDNIDGVINDSIDSWIKLQEFYNLHDDKFESLRDFKIYLYKLYYHLKKEIFNKRNILYRISTEYLYIDKYIDRSDNFDDTFKLIEVKDKIKKLLKDNNMEFNYTVKDSNKHQVDATLILDNQSTINFE